MEHAKSLTKKEATELRKIDRLQMTGRATRAQMLRGMALHRQHNAAYRATHGIQG